MNFELARLKRWKLGAKSETMSAQQRVLFLDTMVEDEASLQAQVASLQVGLQEVPKAHKAAQREPRRQHLLLGADTMPMFEDPVHQQPIVAADFAVGIPNHLANLARGVSGLLASAGPESTSTPPVSLMPAIRSYGPSRIRCQHQDNLLLGRLDRRRAHVWALADFL